MSEVDILEAFSGHPKIGDVKDLEEKYGSSPMEEQASVRLAKTRTLELLKNKNLLKDFINSEGKTAFEVFEGLFLSQC